MIRNSLFGFGRKMLLIIAAIAGICLVTVPAMAETGVEINHKNFPDSALLDAVLGLDENQDGFLQTEEITKAKELRINKFINGDDVGEDEKAPVYQKSDFKFNFQGIQYLAGLESLEVNLSGGATKDGKHYDSVIFNFTQVYRLKKLTSFSFYSAKQKTIYLSKFPKLEKTDLAVTGLTNLKIDNKYLKKVRIGRSTSGLGVLDFRKAPKLNTLYIDNLQTPKVYFNNKKMKQMHIESNGKKKIKSMSLKSLKSLQNLSLTKVNISSLDLSKNFMLVELYLDSCTMKKLDVSKNKKLTWIACEGKHTKSIVLPPKNVISTFKWVNAGRYKFNGSRLNADTLTSVILFGNKIQSLDLKRFRKLDFVFVDKGVKVKLAPNLSAGNIIHY